MSLADLAAQFRRYPVATTIELGSVLVCVLLFVGTVALLSSGPPAGAGRSWPRLLIVGVGTTIVLLWTVLVPLYERY